MHLKKIIIVQNFARNSFLANFREGRKTKLDKSSQIAPFLALLLPQSETK